MPFQVDPTPIQVNQPYILIPIIAMMGLKSRWTFKTTKKQLVIPTTTVTYGRTTIWGSTLPPTEKKQTATEAKVGGRLTVGFPSLPGFLRFRFKTGGSEPGLTTVVSQRFWHRWVFFSGEGLPESFAPCLCQEQREVFGHWAPNLFGFV